MHELGLVLEAVVLQQDVWYATAWQIFFVLAARKFITVQSSVRYKTNNIDLHNLTNCQIIVVIIFMYCEE